MPEYPIDKPDLEGNTPLQLAYIMVNTFKDLLKIYSSNEFKLIM